MTGFLILAFLLLVAMVVSVPLATRFGLGSVLGYLLAGMAIAPLLAALNVDVVALQVFAEFGVVMMLFIIGLEMEPRRLWDMRGKLLGLGGGQVILTTAVITGIALLDARPWQTAVAIGMILALSSTAIIVQSLTEKKLMRTEGGEASFSVLLVQDVAVIPILALLPLPLACLPGVERRARALPRLTHALDPVGAPRGFRERGAHRRNLRIAKGRRCSAARARSRSSSFSIDNSPMCRFAAASASATRSPWRA